MVAHQVLGDWETELNKLAINYEMRVYDDGSSDGTGRLVDDLARHNDRIVVTHQSTSLGHGPTILQGYKEARGVWVFQVDGDNEMKTADFSSLWSKRHSYDFLLGWRLNRQSTFMRRIYSTVARLSVRLLFGGRVRDVNAAYRLMRGDRLAELLPLIDKESLAPNVILTGLAARRGMRMFETGVLYEARKSGGPVISLTFLKLVFYSFIQTLRAAFRSHH